MSRKPFKEAVSVKQEATKKITMIISSHFFNHYKRTNVYGGYLPSCSCDLNNFTPAATPPEGREGPVRRGGTSSPPFFREQQHLEQKLHHLKKKKTIHHVILSPY